MPSIQERASHSSNRVDLIVGFVIGSTNVDETRNRILDGFRVTQDLLLELAQSGLWDEFSRFLASKLPLLQSASSEWDSFVAGQINVWQSAKLHQKTIETVGDLLSNWESETVIPADFDESMRRLEYIVTLEPEKQSTIWAESDQVLLPFRMRSFSLVLTGLAVIASNNPTKDDVKAFTGVCFGASLVVNGMSRLVDTR